MKRKSYIFKLIAPLLFCALLAGGCSVMPKLQSQLDEVGLRVYARHYANADVSVWQKGDFTYLLLYVEPEAGYVPVKLIAVDVESDGIADYVYVQPDILTSEGDRGEILIYYSITEQPEGDLLGSVEAGSRRYLNNYRNDCNASYGRLYCEANELIRAARNNQETDGLIAASLAAHQMAKREKPINWFIYKRMFAALFGF